MRRLQANLLLAGVSAIWGSAFIAQVAAAQAGVAFLYNAATFGIAGLVLLPLVIRCGVGPAEGRERSRMGGPAAGPEQGPGSGISRKQFFWMFMAGILLFGGSAFQQVGLYYTQVANASFLTTLYVISTPFLLWVIYGERPSRVHALAAALATIGAFLLSTGGALVLRRGDVLEVLGAVFWGMHIVLLGRYAGAFDSISFAAGQFLVCAGLNLAAGFLYGEAPAALATPPVMGAVAYRSLLSITVGYTAQVWAQKFTSPNEAALLFALESVFAAIVAALLLHETLGPLQYMGCALILAAAVFSQLRRQG